MQDRSGTLVAVGIVELLVGGVLLLLVPVTIWGGSLQAAGGEAASDARSILVSVLSLLALAAFFSVSGIGTIRRRRWARTLMQSVTALWLIIGAAGFVFWIAISPRLDALMTSRSEVDLPSGAVAAVKLVVSLFLLIVYVALPGALYLTLRSASVRDTFARHDPSLPWTERVSARVLSMILTLVYLGATGLMLVPYGGAPFFGILLGRGLSAVVWILVVALCAFLARGFYRGDRRAVWGTVALTAVGTLSAVWTFLRVDLDELWRAFGLRPEQLELLSDSWLLSRAGLIWMTLLSAASVAGYAIYVRRDLSPRLTPPAIRGTIPGHE